MPPPLAENSRRDHETGGESSSTCASPPPPPTAENERGSWLPVIVQDPSLCVVRDTSGTKSDRSRVQFG